jgi:hypothetical protein
MGYVAPRTATEEMLADIWAEVLKLDRVGIHDNFFELGGHSLLVLNMVAKIQANVQLRNLGISIQQVFQHPTVALLANITEGGRQQNWDLVSGTSPLLPNNHWFLKRLDLNYWNASFVVELVDSYEPSIVRQAIELLTLHHDVLRSVWTRQEDGWVQHYRDASDMPDWWTVVDLSQCPDAALGDTLQEICTEIQPTLDIGNCLFKVIHFDFGGNRGARVAFIMHHLLVDGYSQSIFIQDLALACASLKQGTAPALPPKTSSIKEAAEYLQDHAQSQEVLAALDYWRSRPWHQFRPLPPEKHVEKLAMSSGFAETGIVFAELSPEETVMLERIQNGPGGITAEDALIAAIVLAFEKWSGSPSLLINLTHHGRFMPGSNDIDLSRTMGWVGNYTNCLFDVGEAKTRTLRDAVQAVQAQHDEIRGKESYYSLLRFMHEDETVRKEIASLPSHQVEFNFIPRVATGYEQDISMADRAEMHSAGLRPAKERAGSNDGPMHAGFAPFSKAFIENDRLIVYWIYCTSTYSADTFGLLLRENLRFIREIIYSLGSEAAPEEVVVNMQQK